MKKPIGEEAKAMFHAITVAGRKKWSVYFRFLYFAQVNGKNFPRNQLSAEFTLALHRKCTPRKVDSAEAIVHMRRTMVFAFSAVSAASAEFTWP